MMEAIDQNIKALQRQRDEMKLKFKKNIEETKISFAIWKDKLEKSIQAIQQ